MKKLAFLIILLCGCASPVATTPRPKELEGNRFYRAPEKMLPTLPAEIQNAPDTYPSYARFDDQWFSIQCGGTCRAILCGFETDRKLSAEEILIVSRIAVKKATRIMQLDQGMKIRFFLKNEGVAYLVMDWDSTDTTPTTYATFTFKEH